MSERGATAPPPAPPLPSDIKASLAGDIQGSVATESMSVGMPHRINSTQKPPASPRNAKDASSKRNQAAREKIREGLRPRSVLIGRRS